MKFLIGLFLAIVFEEMSQVNACSCAMGLPQEHFCYSSFVILGTIKERRIPVPEVVFPDSPNPDIEILYEEPNELHYWVCVDEIFKGVGQENVVLVNGVAYVSLITFTCVVFPGLPLDTPYLFMGHMYKDEMRLSLYDMKRPWQEVSETLVHNLRTGFGGCDERKIVNEVKVGGDKSDDECLFVEVKDMESSCRRDDNKVCNWI